MRVTWIAIAAALGGAGCKGGGKAKAKPPVIADAAPTEVVVVTDAGRPWYALPIDASPDAREYSTSTLPDLGDLGGPVQLLMADAPVGATLTLFAAPRTMAVGPSDPSARITGRLSADHAIDLLAMLAQSNHDQFPVPVTGAKGHAPTVDLQFAAAPVRDLFRLFGDVERRSYVLPPGTLHALDIVAKRVPSDAAAHAAATAAGLSAFDVHGNLTFIHDPAQPGLDPALIARKGPTVDLDAHGAHAGELYAALVALGVDPGGGAGCSDGDTIDLRVKKVTAGVAIAAIAAATGIAPGAGVCAPAAGDPSTFTEVHAIARAGKHAVAIVTDPKDTAVLDSTTLPPDTIGAGYVRGTSDVPIALYPDPAAPSGDPGAWTKDLASARLAALLYDGESQVALVEMPDGTTHLITAGTSYRDGVETFATILDNTLTVSTYAYNSGNVEATLRLRAK